MTRVEVFAKLTDVFRDVFDNDNIQLSDLTTANDIDEWDSLMHITLISEIEDAFGVHFAMKEVTKMQNVGEMVDKIITMI